MDGPRGGVAARSPSANQRKPISTLRAPSSRNHASHSAWIARRRACGSAGRPPATAARCRTGRRACPRRRGGRCPTRSSPPVSATSRPARGQGRPGMRAQGHGRRPGCTTTADRQKTPVGTGRIALVDELAALHVVAGNGEAHQPVAGAEALHATYRTRRGTSPDRPCRTASCGRRFASRIPSLTQSVYGYIVRYV